jgi:hypothetical protein
VLSGGVLLGALYGRVDPEEDDKPLMELACQYRQQDHRPLGSSLCNPIRDTMPEELTKRCAEVVHEAARLWRRSSRRLPAVYGARLIRTENLRRSL